MKAQDFLDWCIAMTFAIATANVVFADHGAARKNFTGPNCFVTWVPMARWLRDNEKDLQMFCSTYLTGCRHRLSANQDAPLMGTFWIGAILVPRKGSASFAP